MTISSKAPAKAFVAVLGASPKAGRYSLLAVQMLKEHGYRPIPVHPAGHEVDGIHSRRSLEEITEQVDTLTIYVNESISEKLASSILDFKPRRVIFNPGAENPFLAQKLADSGIMIVEACTLVMLRTNQF